jgi:glycosyltransferase involved in cell wall biosynthesis
MVEPAPMLPRLFFELTLSQRLVGQPPVGIVRTEIRLASHLLRSRPGLYHFCVFHADLGEFVALDRDETIAILEPAAPRRGPLDDPAIVPCNGWLEHRVKRPVRRIARSLKARIPARLPPSLIEFGQSAGALRMAAVALCRSLVDYARDAITTRPPPPADDRLPIDFRRGDVLITVGMAWQDGFLARLLAKKQEHGIKVVMFCHDLIPIDFPHLVAPSEVVFFQRCYADLVGCADKILCNSSYTRDRLVHFLANFDHRPILATLELGSDPLPATTLEWPAALPPLRPGRFVLCVSTVEIRKNHRLIYHLWSRLNETEPALLPPLVCVGGPGWRTDDLMRLIAADRNLRGKLILLRGLADGDLGWLYRNCAFTLYPSFVEGWGLPVAESLSYGKYCVASTAPSIAELSRGLLDLLDPLDFAAWHREIRRLLTEPGYLRAKERRIATYRPRDWASAGEQFVAETAAFR